MTERNSLTVSLISVVLPYLQIFTEIPLYIHYELKLKNTDIHNLVDYAFLSVKSWSKIHQLVFIFKPQKTYKHVYY